MATREEIIEALEKEAAAHGIDIVDVELSGGDKPTLCVRIDFADEREEVISLEEVAQESAWIGTVLDELDPIEHAYTLEVSSPGMARPLRKARDFERFSGEQVKLTTLASEGRRNYTGTLLGIDGNVVRLDCDGEQVEVVLSDIKKCTIKPNYVF